MNNTINKRERLIDSAAVLFHRHGMNATSLADIAAHAEIPIGNVYYYFKTKEELALAALSRRREQFAQIYKNLQENCQDPRQRLIEITNFHLAQREEYAKYGCPIGKMIDSSEGEGEKVAQIAAQIFTDAVDWAEAQFRALGHADAARVYATSLLAGIEGAIVMAKAFKNPDVINDEVSRLTAWLEALPNKRVPLGKAGMRAATDVA